MLDHIEVIFREMEIMMKKLKKASYEKNMKEFREKHNHYFCEMIEYIDSEADKDAAAEHIAKVFIDAVENSFSHNGKIKAYIQVDLNLFMIYYVFPAILLTEHQDADRICEMICRTWNGTFRESEIQYESYDKIYEAFRDKMFGIF